MFIQLLYNIKTSLSKPLFKWFSIVHYTIYKRRFFTVQTRQFGMRAMLPVINLCRGTHPPSQEKHVVNHLLTRNTLMCALRIDFAKYITMHVLSRKHVFMISL